MMHHSLGKAISMAGLVIGSLIVSASPSLAVIVSNGDVFPAGIGPGDANVSPFNVGGDFSAPGNGSVVVDDGSRLTVGPPIPFVNVAPLAGSNGTVTVTGTDAGGNPSTLRVQGTDGSAGAFLTVGRSGNGTLNIQDGAKVQVDTLGAPLVPATSGGFQVGRNPGSNGTVNIDGANSELSIDSDFAFGRIARDGQGEMNITNGGKLTYAGKNSVLSVSSAVFTPTNGTGVLNVNSGGTISGPVFLDVGGSQGGSGTVNLDGSTSSISLTGACTPDCPVGFSFPNQGAFITVGANQGTGTFNVTNGAKVSIDSSQTPNAEFPGFNLGGSSILGPKGDGTMNVVGDGSEVRVIGNRGFFSIGRLEEGKGALNISGGGQVILENGDGRSRGFVGDRPGADGRITVDGPDSLLDAGSFLGIGVDQGLNDAGGGTVTLKNGGVVKAADIQLGRGGRIGGNGTLMGDVTVGPQSVVAPGESTGEIVVDGDFIFQDGVLQLEANSLTDLDKLIVTGNAVFSGGVIEVLLGFVPDTADVLDFFSITGSTTFLPGFEGVVGRIAQGASVPLGTPISLALGGMIFQAVALAEPPAVYIFLVAFAALGVVQYGRRFG